jgi:predicted RNA methylase
MWAYRLYQLNEAGKYSGPAEVVTAETDEEAIQVARQMTGHQFELWHQRRLVASSELEVAPRPTLAL